MEHLRNPGFISCFCLVTSPWKVFGNRRTNCFRLRFHAKGDVSLLPTWRSGQSHSGVKWERVVQWQQALLAFSIFGCQHDNSKASWLKQRLQHPFFVFTWSDSLEQSPPVLSKIPTRVHSSLHTSRVWNENANKDKQTKKQPAGANLVNSIFFFFLERSKIIFTKLNIK